MAEAYIVGKIINSVCLCHSVCSSVCLCLSVCTDRWTVAFLDRFHRKWHRGNNPQK